jgi:hypothetical protein
MKHYLNNLLCHCAPENGFAQDAIEWAIVSDHIQVGRVTPGAPTGGQWTVRPTTDPTQFDQDVALIMSQYDEIIEGYRAARLLSQPLIDLMQEKFGLPITELTSGEREERLAA